MAYLKSLKDIFASLNNVETFNAWTKERTIKVILGASVIKVFVKDTKPELTKHLKSIDVTEIQKFQHQEQYDVWHAKQMELIYDCLKDKQGNLERINNDEGLKYGHAAKILNLFIGHIVFYSPYFDRKDVEIVKYFLHIPLDSRVFDVLRECGVKKVPQNIKKVTKVAYETLQSEIRANSQGVPPLYFDEYAWAFDKT